MEALISQYLPMMHCGPYSATLTLKHKLISCSIPPRINRGPSTCFLSRFCLFLFPHSCLSLSPQVPPSPPAPCGVEMHLCERTYSKCPCAVHQHLWVCVHWQYEKGWDFSYWEPSASAGKLVNFFWGNIKIQQPSVRLLRWMRLASIVTADNQTSTKLLPKTTF